MPHRLEINVMTGERKVIELTQEEIDDANARTLAERSMPAPLSLGRQTVNMILADPAALAALKTALG